jgi:hypothetical protein
VAKIEILFRSLRLPGGRVTRGHCAPPLRNSFDAETDLAAARHQDHHPQRLQSVHGGVWQFHTNSALRARNFFNFSTAIPKNILNQYGYRIGGGEEP